MALCEEPHKAASLGAGIGRPGRAGLQGGHEMAELSRPVGFGLASRGSVSEVVAWSERARREGLDSVWVHDSYFERDAVTYASAIASGVGGIRVGMGALNPLTRHPVLVAMTVSAIDEMAPGRVLLGMGTGLPLRLGQMGIPYSPDAGLEAVSKAIDTMRALWSGERVPPGQPGLPPVQPMFPPVHRVPIYIAAYRSAFLRLAGAKADGYLARPAESIASLRRMLETLRVASVAAGRPEDAVEVAGYLLTLVDRSRREALNRAKREPFVIYMMSVQSDLAMRRAGLDPELKDRVAAAWRAEDYHRAANLIPDELLDAFMLCGTREEVAAGAAGSRRGCRPGRRGLAGAAPALDRTAAGGVVRDRAAVQLHGLDRAGGRGRRPGGAGRPAGLATVRGGADRGCAAARRHQHHQRDLRRPQGHRQHHLAARQPRAPQGPAQRARGVRAGRDRVRRLDGDRDLAGGGARLAGGRARRARAGRRARLHRPATGVQVP